MKDKQHKLLEIKTNKLVNSLFVWNYKTNIKWNWIEFVDYKEYDYSDDVKNIDFLKSDKEWKTLVKLFEEERDLNVYFIIDLNTTFFEKYTETRKIDIVYEIFYLIWLSAIKQWDKVWLFVFDSERKEISFAKKWKQNFSNLVNILDTFWEDKSRHTNIKNIFNNKNKFQNTSWLKYFNSLKINKSVVFLLTDNLEMNEKDLKVLWLKNDLILCNVFNSFENNLNNGWLKKLKKWSFSFFVDLDKKNKVEEFTQLRNKKINSLKRKIHINLWRYVLFDETKNTHKEISKLFRN